MKKRKGKGRTCVYDGTVNHPLANDVIKCACYRVTLEEAAQAAGPVTKQLLRAELNKIERIENIVNNICTVKGIASTRERTEQEDARLQQLEEELVEVWASTADLDYLRTFPRQVDDDEFFEKLLESSKKHMIRLQNHLKYVESAIKKNWMSELVRLKRSGYATNFERIVALENLLNAASEKYVIDRLSNYLKSEVLNSEKMTPKFLKIAEKTVEISLSVIKDNDGNPFGRVSDRHEHIVSFYEKLYKNPENMPNDFSNCVEDFLGDLVDHPVIRDCRLNDEDRRRLDAPLTAEELDEALKNCNMRSAPGIDGINNRFIKKFWPFFREPLKDYFECCRNKGSLTRTFSTALIKLLPKKGDTTQIKNWRPISLLSCFYKVISKAVNTRLNRVIDKLTSLNQKAYNKNRFIHEAVMNTVDTIRYCENNNVKGVILSIDQRKAFDSVFHGFIMEVYKFFRFGESFIQLLETIGTGRSSQVILDDGKLSRNIDLDRGFMQGDGPSPRLYNIGEQILLFKLEYDPALHSVYVSFLIPRQIINGEVRYPEIEVCEQKGIPVDPELKHHNRKVPAFADDSTGSFKRDITVLKKVKEVLIDFGRISGLETNVEKTTLMPIGCLNEPLDEEIIGLGFEIVDEIKCLGFKINNRASNLQENFDPVIGKIRQLIGSWDRYNLSLPGKIGVAKTMLLSQIGYIGSIITLDPGQVNTMQELIDGYVKKGLVIAADRLYKKPKHGGLGMIKIEHYITALQCSWIKRCSAKINDTWRWTLAASCSFVLGNLRRGSVSKRDNPVLANIVESFVKFQEQFWLMNENYLQAQLVDNGMFLRAPPDRRAPVRGIVDRNLIGPVFYDRHKETLHTLKLNCLIENNTVVDFQTLRANTGLNFTQATYFNLVTAANFAIKKYAKKDGSNGTDQSVDWFLSQVKRGSKKFRKMLEKKDMPTNVGELRVVKTFFQLIQCEVPDNNYLEKLYGCWNWNFLSNRIRVFCFQYFNNSLGTKTRIAARYRNGGIALDNLCTFCVKSNAAEPAREDFAHVFYECTCISNTRNRAFDAFFPADPDPVSKKLTYLTGIVRNASKNDKFFYILTSMLINYVVWQFRMKKVVPGIASIMEDVENLFDMCVSVSKKISNLVIDASSPICRRWRARHHGRG